MDDHADADLSHLKRFKIEAGDFYKGPVGYVFYLRAQDEHDALQRGKRVLAEISRGCEVHIDGTDEVESRDLLVFFNPKPLTLENVFEDD